MMGEGRDPGDLVIVDARDEILAAARHRPWTAVVPIEETAIEGKSGAGIGLQCFDPARDAGRIRLPVRRRLHRTALTATER
jgi:hypothetical protein